VFEPAVISFDRVVRVLLDVVPRRRDQLLEHAGVDRGGVGDHLAGCHFQCRQRPSEEPPRGVSVPAGRDEYVDDLPVLVDGSIHVPPHAVDLDVRLVDEPPVTRRVSGEPGRVGQQWREPMYPAVDGDVVDFDAAFDQ
jgi:hypothetical protein